jgi:hypothetical protein
MALSGDLVPIYLAGFLRSLGCGPSRPQGGLQEDYVGESILDSRTGR